MGAGSIIESLRDKFDFKGPIDAVEFDQKIIEIAAEDFNITESDSLRIHNEDAFTYVQNNPSKFDLIIVDLFIDAIVPKQFYSAEFWTNTFSLLSKKGSILFNVGVEQSSKSHLKQLKDALKDVASFEELLLDDYNNYLLVIRRKHS